VDIAIRDILMNPDVESVTWGKLVLNAVINPITALLGLENGQLVDGTNSYARSMLTKALMEAVTVARARVLIYQTRIHYKKWRALLEKLPKIKVPC